MQQDSHDSPDKRSRTTFSHEDMRTQDNSSNDPGHTPQQSPIPDLLEAPAAELNSNSSDTWQKSLSELDTGESGLCEPRSRTNAGTEEDYRQHLHRLFGKEMADYFLVPSPVHTQPSAWYNLLIQHMGDHVSAVALWEALREHSTRILLDQEENQATYNKVIQVHVTEATTVEAWQRRRGHQRRMAGVITMFNLAQLRQAFSAQLLHAKAPLLPTEPRKPFPQSYDTLEST